MKILIVSDHYYPNIGGVETLARNLAEGLAKNHSVTIVTRKLPGTKPLDILNDVRIRRIRCPGRISFPAFALSTILAESVGTDVIHALTPNGSIAAWLGSRLSGKRCLLTVHEVWSGNAKELTRLGRIERLAQKLFEQIVYSFPFDFYACVSSSTLRQLQKSGFARNRKAGVIYNAFDAEKFSKSSGKIDVRRKLNLKKDFVCLTYGRTGPSKGIEFAAKAIPLVEIPNFRHLFALSKDDWGHYKKVLGLFRSGKLNGKALLRGPVSDAELPDYIRAADCVVVPSLTEGFGYAVVEACALKKPVVAADTASIPEVISGKHVLVKPADSKAIAEGIERVWKGKWLFSKRKSFTVEKCLSSYIKIYKKISGSPTG